MRPRSRRIVVVVLLTAWSTAGCHRAAIVDGPRPGKEIAGIVLHDGERIVFPGSYRGVVEGDSIAVRRQRDGSLVRTYPVSAVAQVMGREIDPGRTAALVVVGGLVVILGLYAISGIEYGPILGPAEAR